ncbi:hypothetical protein like AT2G27240 [Hibiscus trionum]|uniref:Aluminum-activated malate transporter n=1 Tax=Hibiscus trionum TaxID=183268 RepID=A0A9W7HW09_HIBTR|nr:hypothetical protein like AT2G27240 [Hibiscus trionum]
MNLEQGKQQQGRFDGGPSRIEAFRKNVNAGVLKFVRNVRKLGRDDPRRVVHSLKVGLALTLVSLLQYCQPLYDSFGVSAMWAVITVVLVFEFSVGATLGKGVMRGLATLLAAALAVGAHHVANQSGRIAEPILLGFFVFLQAVVFTFARFYPTIKARYDYGSVIFILTFSFVSVSGYREDEIVKLAYQRLSTILIGGSACIIISILVSPVWAGEELHNLIASNIDKLAGFLQGFGHVYFEIDEDLVSNRNKSFLHGYKTVLNSKNSEDSLANFAGWEPGHGRFLFRHPWEQYLKIGARTRRCAYRIESLNCHLNPHAKPEIPSKIRETCTEMSLECGRALKELALSIRSMVKPLAAYVHIEKSKSAAENLNSLLQSSGLWGDNTDLLQFVPLATVVSLLIDVVNCTEEIAESVYELASMVNFEAVEPTVSPEKPETGQSKPLKSSDDVNSPSVIIVIDEPSLENGTSSATTTDSCSKTSN